MEKRRGASKRGSNNNAKIKKEKQKKNMNEKQF